MSKVNILHVVSNLNCGGAETLIMNLYRNIDKSKFNFDFICLNSKINGAYEPEILKSGGKIYKVQEGKSKLKTLHKILKENNYEVVHSHVMFYSGFVHIISKINNVKKRITHSHSTSDTKRETIFRKLYMSFSRILINIFSNIKISCGDKAAKYLYGHNKNYIILKNGIDLDKYCNVSTFDLNKLRDNLKLKEDDFIIGHVGNFLDVKNQIYFVDFAKEMIKYNKKVKIVLVGDGKNYNEISNIIKKEKLTKYIILAGHRDDINIFMNLFDAFVMPSLYEGFPLVVVEALAGDNICFLSDNISNETNLIEGRVFYFNLLESKEKLIDNILKTVKNKKNIDIKSELTKKGYSIKETTNIISSIYLK